MRYARPRRPRPTALDEIEIYHAATYEPRPAWRPLPKSKRALIDLPARDARIRPSASPDRAFLAAEPSRITKRDRDRLAKLLGMFGSDREGERENARLQIEKESKRLGLSWQDLIDP